MLGKNLKRAGHTRYSETTKRIFKKFESGYGNEISEASLASLKNYFQHIHPVINNIRRNSKHDQIRDMARRLELELDRLIQIQEKNLTPLN